MTEPERLQVTGHYAGAVSRAASAIVDIWLIFALFTVGVAGINVLTQVLLGVSVVQQQSTPGWIIAFVTWAFLYIFVSLSVAGRTAGKGLVGLRVVTTEGTPLPVGRALGRTAVLPLSILLLPIVVIGVLLQREHRALHDLIAKTAVVYDWGTRTAEMPGPLSAFIARQAGAEYAGQKPDDPPPI